MKLIEKIKKIDDKKLEEWTIKSSNAILLITFILITIIFIVNVIRTVFDF